MRTIPISSTQTLMEYEIYRHNNATDEEFKYMDDFFKQVVSEDKGLCNAAQKNLNAGLYTNGQLHPELEKVCTNSKRQKTFVLTTIIGRVLCTSRA